METTDESTISGTWDWADRGTSHVNFSRDEKLPFQEGEVIGHGVNGPVFEATIKETRVAVKKIFCRRKVSPKELEEIGITTKLQHQHIIRLLGSYTRGNYLGMFLYPVARCDLATFLEDLDHVQKLNEFEIHMTARSFDPDDHVFRCAEVSRFPTTGIERTDHLILAARRRINESYLCIASAIEYLHKNSIRHKDLKPMNILLSRNGLWVTDFGHAVDFTEFSHSATSGGERGTLKYCAPEVAAFEKSGRAADIFSLGCVFFEMAALRCYSLESLQEARSASDRSFSSNLDNILPIFTTFGSRPLDHLHMCLVRKMICKDSDTRLPIAEVNFWLMLIQIFESLEESLAGAWCHTRTSQTPSPLSFVEEVVVDITIGNTCHEHLPVHEDVGNIVRTVRFPVVVFVDVSYPDIVSGVVFFLHSSSKDPFRTVVKPPFAIQLKVWGVFTVGVLVLLHKNYVWKSPNARMVSYTDQDGTYSALPLDWYFEVEDMYDSQRLSVPVGIVKK